MHLVTREETMYPWTVYCDGEVIDIYTDQEAEELLGIFQTVYVKFETGIIEIVE